MVGYDFFKFAIAGAAVVGALAASPASAGLVYDSSISISAQGFGNAHRALTIQESGPRPNGVESGCVSSTSSGTLIGGSGACLTGDAPGGNGVVNVGGDESSPLSDNQKFGIPTLGELGYNSASDIQIIFNATEPQGNKGSINVLDLTLKFMDGDDVVFAIDGEQDFASATPGNGSAGFVFVIDEAFRAAIDSLIFGATGFGDYRLALEATLSLADGGPDTFRFIAGDKDGEIPVPEPAAAGLLGLGLLALRLRRRRAA